MAKEMFSFRIDSGLRDVLAARAERENRSVSNMAEVLLAAALTERDQGRDGSAGGLRAAGSSVLGGGGSTAPSAPVDLPPSRSVSPADVAATVPGVTVASAVCAVSPPGRTRPSCSLPAKHDGKHSWEL